uniref:Tumor necrosis factor alpha-induced protein 8-like protein n=1 Tax=Bursaphelenchus xylophilus TaxID=6326 RepID=A0A1I7SRM8_BURXY
MADIGRIVCNIFASVYFLFLIFVGVFFTIHDFDKIPEVDEKLWSNNQILQATNVLFDQNVGQKYVSKNFEEADALLRYKTRFTYFTVMVLADDYSLLEKDVNRGNGSCLLVCEKFIVYFNMALGHLCKKDQKDLAKSLGQAAEPMTEVVKHIILTVSGNKLDVIIKAAKELKKNGERLKARDFFYH